MHYSSLGIKWNGRVEELITSGGVNKRMWKGDCISHIIRSAINNSKERLSISSNGDPRFIKVARELAVKVANINLFLIVSTCLNKIIFSIFIFYIDLK